MWDIHMVIPKPIIKSANPNIILGVTILSFHFRALEFDRLGLNSTTFIKIAILCLADTLLQPMFVFQGLV